jgi:hypothetical protein
MKAGCHVSPTTATQFFPVMDDYAVVRALILVDAGHEWECKQRLNHVVVAISYILGERASDATNLSDTQARRELARRTARRPPNFSAETIGLLAIHDESNVTYALVSVLDGRESECQRVATAVQFTISRFERRQMYIRVYEI